MQAPPAERSLGIVRLVEEIASEVLAPRRVPPGELGFSMWRTHRFQRETLQMLLAYYERYGPVFSFRSLHRRFVALIGPEANHFVTVSGAEHFSWRKGMFGEQLNPLIGNGLITTDWEYHDRARRIMLPAFHRRRLDAAVAVMADETERALASWQPGGVVDFYEWVRDVAMSIAMRALVGLDPRSGGLGHEAAEVFERALSFYDTESWMMMLRGPMTPWARLQAARRELDRIIFEQIERRRAAPGGNQESDVLTMLLDARDEDGQGFTDEELRDQLMHLLFGGHDTTSSTISFLFYELGRNPEVLGRVVDELDSELGGQPPTADQLISGLPYFSQVVDETLRLYPPVWFGPRMSVTPFELHGHRIPAGVHVLHSSWVTHRLPEVFPNPEAFMPDRFAPEARRAIPPGGYIPFGGGQRICIGKRFGQMVVKTVSAIVLQRFRCELRPGYVLEVGKLPTLSPEGGLPVTIRERSTTPFAATAR